MADGALTAEAPPTVLARLGGWRVWQRVIAVYAAARLVTTLLMLVSSALAPADGRHGENPSILDYISGWDAAWYREIVLNGYPSDLPRDDSGNVAQNAWAFMPIYPVIVRALSIVVPGAGLGSDDVWAVADAWGWCAALVSLVAGYAACRALFAVVAPRMGDEKALWAVAFLAFNPLGLMFQVGYAESMWLACVLWAVWALERRRWVWLYVLIPILAFTRPGELALPLTIALYGIWRLLRRREEEIRRSEVVHILALGALGTLLGFAWPVIADAVTGDPSGYLDTELAWRRGWTGDETGGFLPGGGWVQGASVWAGLWGIPAWAGYLLLAAIAASAVLLFRIPAVRALSMEMRLWAASYLVYLALVVFPQSSILRMLLPVAPLVAAAIAGTRLLGSTRVLILAASVAAQFWWIHEMYGVGNTYYLIP
ncbi:hypothetical protein [Microbacterium indicum]|uniref:hypothetical protein n=1 Tax=Microbacterium indicum TaxID=358100 RepID=UPI0003F53B4E|nr:hypothetical protein [Microbacterium indicum]